MIAPAASPGKHLVFLLSEAGPPLTHFETDRNTFPEVATHDGGSVFRLLYQGGLIFDEYGCHASASSSVRGAIYVPADIWHISARTIETPRLAESADILPFGARQEGGET